MDFNGQPPSHLLDAWSAFPQNLAGFPFNHDDQEFLHQYGSIVDHHDVPAHKRARQSEDSLPNFPCRMIPPPIPFNSRINPPPILSSGVRGGSGHIFYKTRLCVKFSEGNCRNGDSCNFAHGVHDLRHPPTNWQELVGGRKELGTGRSDEEHRRNQNIRVCKRYYNGEECPYGEKCVFLHERPTPTPSFLDEGQLERTGERESDAISIGVSSNQVRTGGYRSETNNNKPPVYWNSKPGERNHFDHHVQTGSHASLSCNEADKSGVIQSNPFVAAPFGDPINRRDKDDNASRWKLNKKINRIYADWLEYLSPPRNVESVVLLDF